MHSINIMDSTTTTTKPSTKVLFSSMVQQERVPTREQAIILDSMEGLTVQEYTVALAKIINPKDIHYVSRISHGRICFYLSSKELADQLVDNNTKITVGSSALEIRPLVSKAKRIIISNVQPCIPSSIIENELKKLDITPVSQITSVRAGIYLPELGHILSFRKQMYVNPDDIPKIPHHVQISHQNVNYWIYFSADKLSCFYCKEEGHLAKYCKNSELNPTLQSADIQSDIREIENVIPINNSPANDESIVCPANSEFPPLRATPGIKRPLSTSTSTPSNQEDSMSSEMQTQRGNMGKPSKSKKKKEHPLLVSALICCAAGQFGGYRGFPSQNAYRPTPKPNFQQPIQPQYNTPQYNSPGRFIAIRSQQKDSYPDGSYSFNYDTENGISVSESGRPQGTGQSQSEVVQGRYSYTAPDGSPITVEYTADENGFHPQGAHLPTPPPIPEAIRRALAANPPGPDDSEYRQPYTGNAYRRY